jgi:hypothetical protein
MIPWLQIYSNLPSHHKTDRLTDALGLPNYAVVGILVKMWSWVTVNASDGNLSKYSNPKKIIEEAIGWTKKKPDLFQALVDVGFIDATEAGYVIHDWKDYSKEGFEEKKKSAAAERQRKCRDNKKSKNKNLDDDNMMDDVTKCDTPHNIDRDTSRDADVTKCDTSHPTIQYNTKHNNTRQYLSPPNPLKGESNAVIFDAGEREERKEKNGNENQKERDDCFESCKAYYREIMGKKPKDDLLLTVKSSILGAAMDGVSAELIKRIIDISAGKKAPPAYLKKALENLIADGVKTLEQYERQYGSSSKSEGNVNQGSFDTDEFFELALRRTYQDMGYTDGDFKKLLE